MAGIIIPGSLGDRLVDAGIINEAQLAEALEIQKTSKRSIYILNIFGERNKINDIMSYGNIAPLAW